MDPMCRFTNIQKQLLAPFVVYADFESILLRVSDEAMDTTQGVAVGGNEPTPVAGPFQEHLSCSFAYKLVSSVVPDFSRPLVSYRGEDAGEFASKLQEEVEQLFQEYIATPQQLLALTKEELRSFYTTNCHICYQQLGVNKVCDIATLWGTIMVLCIAGVI